MSPALSALIHCLSKEVESFTTETLPVLDPDMSSEDSEMVHYVLEAIMHTLYLFFAEQFTTDALPQDMSDATQRFARATQRYVCMCACVCAEVRVHVHARMCMRRGTCACACAHVYMRRGTCACVCAHVYVCICMRRGTMDGTAVRSDNDVMLGPALTHHPSP